MNLSKTSDSRMWSRWRNSGSVSTPHDVGYSVSFCVRDMARGDVDPSKVKMIVAGTAVKTPEGWDGVIEDYKEYYWSEFKEVAEAIFRDFLKRGKVYQPRLDPEVRRAPQLGIVGKGTVIWGRTSDPVTYHDPYGDYVRRYLMH